MKFKNTFGPPGERPESYWHPFLGGQCGLMPRDLADLTCEQLMACFDYVQGD